jgi:Ras-related protein Rab-5C
MVELPLFETARVILLGDSGVGKTTLVHRMKTGEFLTEVIPTIAAGVTTMEVVAQRIRYPLQIWDTAGQELYRSIIPIYFKGADFALLVFAMNDERSFISLDGWIRDLNRHSDNPDIDVIIIETKCDCQDRAVDEQRAKDFASNHHFKLFFVSSLTGQNVIVVTEHIALEFGKKHRLKQTQLPTAPREQTEEADKCC